MRRRGGASARANTCWLCVPKYIFINRRQPDGRTGGRCAPLWASPHSLPFLPSSHYFLCLARLTLCDFLLGIKTFAHPSGPSLPPSLARGFHSLSLLLQQFPSAHRPLPLPSPNELVDGGSASLAMPKRRRKLRPSYHRTQSHSYSLFALHPLPKAQKMEYSSLC